MFNFENDDTELGRESQVDTHRIIVDVEVPERLAVANVGSLTALRATQQSWLIGILEKICKRQAAASIGDQTDGRFILGIGLSGPKVIENWHGLDYYHGSPMQRTREYLELIRLIFSGERVDYQGEIFKVKGFKLRSFEPPVNVPIYLAAFGRKNVQLAGELADGWFPIWTSNAELESVQAAFSQGLARRNETLPKDVEVAPFIVTCASNNQKAKYYVQKQLSFYIGGMGTYYARVVKESEVSD